MILFSVYGAKNIKYCNKIKKSKAYPNNFGEY